MKSIKTKADFCRRYAAGEFGNHAPTWETLIEFAASRYRGLVHLRNRVAGGETFYNLDDFEALCKWASFKDPSQFYCSAMAPTHLTLIQGEVQRGLWGLDLVYSTVRLPMRDSLRVGMRIAQGLTADVLLRKYMNQQSYEWLQYLLDEYEGHVTEFSVYDCEWGTVPGYNTVFWEVRMY